MTRSALCLASVLLLAAGPTRAGAVLDFIRNYDLNDYSLGVAFATSQNPFVGASNSAFAYPYLTSFTHPAFTDDWFLVQGENIGFRHVHKSDWEIGLIGRIQTLGFGSEDNDEVLGLLERRWTIEAGPMVGWRRWPVHVQLRTYWDIANRHNSMTSELDFSFPRKFGRGFFVPSVRLAYLSEDYANYYFGVSAAESTPSRPEYEPGAVTNTWVGLRLGYELTPKWLLSTTVGIEFLDSAVTASPIVVRDSLWSASIGLAYNADLFQPRGYDVHAKQPAIEFRLSAFNSSIDTTVTRDASDSQPGDELDLEDFLGVADQETIIQLDARFRVAYFHRFELAYFELQRRSLTTLGQDIDFGDETFVAGTEVETSMRSEVLRLAYSYSLMRSMQKELGVSIGVSFSQFETGLMASATNQSERITLDAPLPTMGVFGSVAIGSNWQLGAEIQLFAFDFDNYDGYMTYLDLGFERRFGDVLGVGIGYNLYNIRLEAQEDDSRGTLRVRHHGPKLTVSLAF